MDKQQQNGFSLIEILIGIAIFAIIFVGVSYLLMNNLQASFDNQEKIKADFLVAEGLEAVKAIAGNDWNQIKPGTYGLKMVDNHWQLVAEQEKVAQMSKNGARIITISDVTGNNIKKIESKVVWQNITDKLKQASAATLLTNWRNYVSICSDGLDNDGDGKADYPDDPGCVSADDEAEDNSVNPPELPICSDSKDNDGDGISDYPDDPGCSSAADDDETDPTILPACSDNIDNDGDGKADFPQDPGCESAVDQDESDSLNLPQCSDSQDNDGDGYIDYPHDPNCDSAADDDESALIIPEQNKPICSDGLDNDNDGLADYPADPGCDSAADDDENDLPAPPDPTKPACSDGQDNDADGVIDYPYDLGCDSSSDDDETGPICGNGILEEAEECDDNNILDNDGCSGQCLEEIVIDPRDEAICGNGILEKEEECDYKIKITSCSQNIESCQHNCKCTVPICHATDSEVNPYNLISVSYNAVDGNGKNDHSHHSEDIIPIWDVNKDGQLKDDDCSAALSVAPAVIFDNEDTALCKLDLGTISVTGRVILPAFQTAKLQLSYYVVWPQAKRTEIVYLNYGIVKGGEIFSLETPWPGVSAGQERVETHIGAMLLSDQTGNPLLANGASLDYYWYPWVCAAP